VRIIADRAADQVQRWPGQRGSAHGLRRRQLRHRPPLCTRTDTTARDTRIHDFLLIPLDLRHCCISKSYFGSMYLPEIQRTDRNWAELSLLRLVEADERRLAFLSRRSRQDRHRLIANSPRQHPDRCDGVWNATAPRAVTAVGGRIGEPRSSLDRAARRSSRRRDLRGPPTPPPPWGTSAD